MTIIRKATLLDIEEIEKIAELNTIENTRNLKNGFIVSGYTRVEYKSFIEKDFYFYISINDNKEINGVLVAYKSKEIQKTDFVNSIINSKLNKDFILIKQVFTNPKLKEKGIGSALYNHLYKDVAKDIDYAAVIVSEPYNEASVNFHKKNGFEKILSVTPPADKDGVVRNRDVWHKKNNR